MKKREIKRIIENEEILSLLEEAKNLNESIEAKCYTIEEERIKTKKLQAMINYIKDKVEEI